MLSRLAPYATERAWQKWSKTHPNVFTNEIWADQEHNLKLTFPDYIKDVDHVRTRFPLCPWLEKLTHSFSLAFRPDSVPSK